MIGGLSIYCGKPVRNSLDWSFPQGISSRGPNGSYVCQVVEKRRGSGHCGVRSDAGGHSGDRRGHNSANRNQFEYGVFASGQHDSIVSGSGRFWAELFKEEIVAIP